MTLTAATSRSARTGRILTGVVDYAAGSHVRAAAILIAFSLLALLPGLFALPPIDRDESRFAQASKQMIETGDLVDIHFLDRVRYKKPIGIYWLQAGVVSSAHALGVPNALTTIWLYRIPSLLGAIGAVLLTYWTALAFVTRRAAMLAALMLAGSVLLGVEARLATTDAVLLFTCVAAMGALARAYLHADPRRKPGPGWGNAAAFWTALAAGVLIKGPVIVLFAGLTVVTLAVVDRRLAWVRRLRPVSGIIWFLLLVLPWFVAIVLRSGTSFFAGSVGHDMLAKVAGGQESHGAPPGLYFLLFWATFWPGAVLAGLAVPAVWKARAENGTKFLLAWLIPAWLLFELIPTKLPHYVLPLYPAVAILIAGIVERDLLSRRRWLTAGAVWWFLLPLLLTGAAVAGVIHFGGDLRPAVWIAAAGAALCGFFAWWSFKASDAEPALLRALVATVLIAASVYALALPSLTRLFPSISLADALTTSRCRPTVAAVGYQEPSLVFLAGSSTVLADAAGAAEFLAQGGCRVALVEARSEPEFRRRAAAIDLHYSVGPRIEGVNYSNGRHVTIGVYRAEDSDDRR